MILSLLGSILSGGATGLLGTAIQRYADHKNKKLDIEIEKNKYEHQLALLKYESEAKVDIEDSKAFKESITSEPKRYSEGVQYSNNQSWLMVSLDFLRGLIRPVLTIYLAILTTCIYIKAASVLNTEYLSVQNAYDLVTQIINTILYLTTTCVLFWFGTRNRSKQK